MKDKAASVKKKKWNKKERTDQKSISSHLKKLEKENFDTEKKEWMNESRLSQKDIWKKEEAKALPHSLTGDFLPIGETKRIWTRRRRRIKGAKKKQKSNEAKSNEQTHNGKANSLSK